MLENRGLEIIIIALVVLVLFGAKRLPDSARALGKSLRILKAETQALRDDQAPAEPAPASRSSATAAHPAPLPPTTAAEPAGRPGAATHDAPDAQPVRTT